MDFSELMSIEALGWMLMFCGWLFQIHLAYVKRSTRIGKSTLLFILLGLVALMVADWITIGFSSVAVLQIGSILLAWLVYVRRR